MPKVLSKLSIAVLLMAIPSNPVIAAAEVEKTQRSATAAQDINGFRLGMSISELRALVQIEDIGGFQFETKVGDIDYNFGVTPKGRVYRIQSSQQLGQFAVDQQFVATLKQNLAKKYGPPIRQSGDVFHWELTERVANREGQILPFTTMWMTAYVSEGRYGVSLEMTLLDFRILWADQRAFNRQPRSDAQKRIQF